VSHQVADEQRIRLLTVGHGTIGGEELVTLLRRAGVASLVDVRSYPASRRNPQFNREQLERLLPTGAVDYRWDRRLGGFRTPAADSPHVALRNPSFRGYADHMSAAEFEDAIVELLAEAARHPTTVMCSETLWWRCHRRLLADAATLLHGSEVLHLGHDGRLSRHVLTEGVHLRDGPRLVYDGGQRRPEVGLE
jgi:uncharacterized protein (DUF488 family)